MWRKRDCREIEPLLWSYTAHTLPENECEGIAAHLDSCPACRQQAEEYRVTVGLTTTFRDTPAPESATNWNDLMARMEERKAAPAASVPAGISRPRFAFPLWSGAMLAAAALTAFYLMPRPHSQNAPFREGTQPPLVAQNPLNKSVSNIDAPTQNTSGPTKPETHLAVVSPKKKPASALVAARQKPHSNRRNVFRVASLSRVHQKRAGGNVARWRPHQKLLPMGPIFAEPRPLLAKQSEPAYPVDGERFAARDLPQNFEAFAVPAGGDLPSGRSFVMDTIPVNASHTQAVSASGVRELQAW